MPAPPNFFLKAPSATDESDVLKGLRRLVEENKTGPLPKAAREAHYLLAPGILWDEIDGYMEPNLRRLKDLGLRASFVKTDPMGTPESNGRQIALAVRKIKGDVVIIAHSKGGIDAEAAVKNDPAARLKVKKIVAIQTPFQGAGLADWLAGRPLLRHALTWYSRFIRPSRLFTSSPFFRGKTTDALTTGSRAQAPAFPDGVELYSIVSRVEPGTQVRWAFWITAGLVQKVTGKLTDGVVAPEEGIVPGTRFAAIEHAGHVDPILAPNRWTHQFMGARGHEPAFAATLTEAAVRWIFSRP